MLMSVLIFSFASCEKEDSTEDKSKITYFVSIEFEGAEILKFNETGTTYITAIKVNTPYSEPGFTAMEGDTDVTSKVEVEGTVDNTTVGKYDINYSAVNVDGFAAVKTRTVFVYDDAGANTTTDLSGKYDGIRVNKNAGGIVNIQKIAPGVFFIDDICGGYYNQSRGYGARYAGYGYFKLMPDNTLVSLAGFIPGWGDPCEIQNGVYNPATNEITFFLYMIDADFGFDVKLTFKE